MEQEKKIIKIVVLGPESTGKSTLCEQLAAHYNTIWVKEYAREYLLKNGTEYTYENLFDIAQGQMRLEEEAVEELMRDKRQKTKDHTIQETANEQRSTNNDQLLFIDTDLHVIRVWSEFVFNKCDNRILTEITKRNYDLFLLCNTDLPWVKDELREYPDLESRAKLFHFYKEEMIEQDVPWVIINGTYEERLRAAVEAVERILDVDR